MRSSLLCSLLFSPSASSEFFAEDGDSALSLLQLHQKSTQQVWPPEPPEPDQTPEWCLWPWCQTLEKRNAAASGTYWATIGPKDEKPGWYEQAQGLAVGDNTAQNERMASMGTCNLDIMPVKNEDHKYHVDEWPANTCPNTVDNLVKQSPQLFDYVPTYPESVCGQGQARSRNPKGFALGEVLSIDEGPVNTFCVFSAVRPGTAAWNTYIYENRQVAARPWTEHMGDGIKLCQANFPLTQGVTCSRINHLGQEVGPDEMAPANSYYSCTCHRKMDLMRIQPNCKTKTALVAPAGYCPCSDGVALTLKTPLHSNLGGAGPDVDSPPEIIFPEAGVVDGHVVNVRVWTDDTSYKGNVMKNGVKGSLGRLSMKTNQVVTFHIAIVDATTTEVLQLGGALPITFLDLDEGKNGKGRATVSVCDAEQFVTTSSELSTSTTADGCFAAASSTRGNSKDNPSSVEGALTDDVASRRVVSYIMETTDSGIYTFKLNVAKGFGSRNFLFSLTPGAACINDANMPKGCAAALDSQGL